MRKQQIILAIRTAIIFLLLLLGLGGLELLFAANHTGQILGRFSWFWLAGLALYGIFCALVTLAGYWIWLQPNRLSMTTTNWQLRIARFGWPLRALLSFIGLLLPYALLLSPWAPLLEVVTIRTLIFVGAVFLAGTSWVPKKGSLALSYLWGALVIAATFEFTKQFVAVTDYPFKLAWSEGNRLWDYSLYFGRELYQIVGEFQYPSYLTPGRHGLWGLPFLLQETPIALVRFWDGLMWSLPYLLLGITFFARKKFNRVPLLQVSLVLWSFLFLAQGPIYAPLVWGGVLLFALYKRERLWLSLLATSLACFYVGISRWTWLFAPAVWIAVWALLEEPASRTFWQRVRRPLWLGLAGFVGGILSQLLTRVVLAGDQPLVPVSLEQPLLWYRLFPNPTYRLGILINLALAVGPLIFLILVLARRRWRWDWLQWFVVIGSLTGFLVAGLVASVKIGGGSNLHNLDMFLVALLALTAQTVLMIDSDDTFTLEPSALGPWPKLLLAVTILIPAWWTIRSGSPLRLPPAQTTEANLQELVKTVEKADEDGLVLMMDQRQLLTFGQLNTPLAMEYELKHVFNQAMGNNEAYFEQFESDLAAGRYAMIVTIPIKIQYQGRNHQFGEENDAFTRWVSEPLLEHYTLHTEFEEEEIWLMVPKE